MILESFLLVIVCVVTEAFQSIDERLQGILHHAALEEKFRGQRSRLEGLLYQLRVHVQRRWVNLKNAVTVSLLYNRIQSKLSALDNSNSYYALPDLSLTLFVSRTCLTANRFKRTFLFSTLNKESLGLYLHAKLSFCLKVKVMW